MDRRKTVHRMCANVMSLADDAISAISQQASSPVTAGYPSAAADTSDLQTLISGLKADLDGWYRLWRGREPAETPQPGFLGVLGTPADFSNALGDVSPVTRMIRNDYAYAGALAMAYEQLYAVGLALGNTAPGLAGIAMSGLEDIVPEVQSLSETMCRVTIRELHNEDATIPLSLANKAVTDTQAAWS